MQSFCIYYLNFTIVKTEDERIEGLGTKYHNFENSTSIYSIAHQLLSEKMRKAEPQ